MAHLALDAKSGRAMAIKQECVNVSPCKGHGQDLVEGGTKRSELLASIIVQQRSPIRWVASDGWQLNLTLAAAVAEHGLSYRAACLLAQEMLCSTKATDVSHEANGEALCPDVCELLQLALQSCQAVVCPDCTEWLLLLLSALLCSCRALLLCAAMRLLLFVLRQ